MGVRVREKQRGSGVWWVFIKHHGKRTSKRVGDKRPAERVASEIRRQLAAGDFHLPTTGPAFRDVAAEWLERYPLVNALRQSTLENHRSFTDQHLVPYFGHMPVTAITTATVEDFIALKLGPNGSTRFPGKPLSMPSLRTGIMALRLILQHAVTRGHIPANPMDMLRLKRRRVDLEDSEDVDPFSGDELRAVLEAAQRLDPDFATLLWLWAQTGMRVGEVCALQWHDLDLEQGRALVRRTWSRGRVGPTKTGLSRFVGLTHPVPENAPEWRPGTTPGSVALLARLRQLRERPIDPEAFVFGGATGRPIPSWGLHHRWRRVLASAKVRLYRTRFLGHS
jgi:integrase